MEKNENILLKIKSKYIFNNIFEYLYDYSYKYRLLKYSNIIRKKFDISIIDYQKISSIIKYKLVSPENILENKKRLFQNASKDQKDQIKEIMNKIIIISYEKEMKEFLVNNAYDYYSIKNEK